MRINAQLIGEKSNLGVKMLHMPSVSESWVLGVGLWAPFGVSGTQPQTVTNADCELDQPADKR